MHRIKIVSCVIAVALLLLLLALPVVQNLMPPAGADSLGMVLVDVDTNEKAKEFLVEAQGIYVLATEENSVADEAGVRSGDQLLMVNGQPLGHASEMAHRLSQAAPDGQLQLVLLRQGAELRLSIRLAGEGTP